MTTPTPEGFTSLHYHHSQFITSTQLYFIGTFEAIHHQDNTIRGMGQLKHETKHIKTSFCHITFGQETTLSMFSPQFEAGSGVIGLYNFYINFV